MTIAQTIWQWVQAFLDIGGLLFWIVLFTQPLTRINKTVGRKTEKKKGR